MRLVSLVKCGPLLPNAPAMNVALPPAAGTHTSSAAPVKPPDSRTVCAGLRSATTRFPSGDHDGLHVQRIAGGELHRLSARGRNLVERCRRRASTSTNAIHWPSGDHAGCASLPGRSVRLSRRAGRDSP